MRVMALCAAALLLTGQQLHFTVASIKERDGRTPLGLLGMERSPGRLVSRCATLKSLLSYAYNLTLASPIKGLPAWADVGCSEVSPSDTYEFQATMPPETTEAQSREMMRTFLAERFKLSTSSETRKQPIYALVIAPGGFKQQQSDPKADPRGFIGCPPDDRACHAIVIHSGPISALAGLLSPAAGRPVVDKTGLTGTYRLDLIWAGDSSPNTSLPSLRGALKETLGLELNSETGAVQVLVIKHAEKPSPN